MANSSGRGGQEYLRFEKEVKMMRRTYVDLIQFIATRQEWLAHERERLKKFREVHFQEFVDVYAPMLRDIKNRFVGLLNSKAYDLDSELWDRAKKSQIVRKFFRDARIEKEASHQKLFFAIFSADLIKIKPLQRQRSFLAY